MEDLLKRLGCGKGDLADFGYYKQSGNIYLIYESNTDLRDTESVPLSDSIHTAITIKEGQIEKLIEYKTTLINGAVTGKIRVPSKPSKGDQHG